MQVRDWEDVVVVVGEEAVVVAVVVVGGGSRGRNILPIPCVVMHNLVPVSSVKLRLMWSPARRPPP